MPLQLIGPHPFARDDQGRQQTRIGTLFLTDRVLYTQAPAVHAWQRAGFVEWLNACRAGQSLPPLSAAEEEKVFADSVDLIFDPAQILIRPNPEQMDLAFAADELLQELVSKRQIIFLSVSDLRVRDAIKQRGECWRLSTIPKSREGKQKLIAESKVGIRVLPIYYYNRLTGTRWLTCEEFANLGKHDDAQLARQLQEIADHANRRNRQNRPEVDFFATDLRPFGAAELCEVAYEQLPADQLRARFETLTAGFRAAVHDAFRHDDSTQRVWCDRILSTLFLDGNETQTEQILSGLSPEFFLQVEWLPGGRLEEGEFMFDSIFEEEANPSSEALLPPLCDPRAQGIIFNLIREYGDIEYVNVGRVPESLSLDRPQRQGRRGVYLAELLSRTEHHPIKRVIRLQKWGVWEHLDEGKDLLQSIQESDEYTDYWFDRRLGCRQLGMNLAVRVWVRGLREVYLGNQERYRGTPIRTTYFEREFLDGIATDKLPADRYGRPGYALALAGILGKAAASSMIVGRALEQGTRPVFDDGDEVVNEGPNGLPVEIVMGDHSGAFGDYRLPLDTFAAHYARPVNTRDKILPEAREFARCYLGAFRDQFSRIQGDYRKRRRAFDTLFKHCKYDPAGSFAYRWECALRRLDQTDVGALIESISQRIWVLHVGKGAGSK